ncbi:MAG TPA: KUP/HAK/KT family potassium transporter [Polyangiaceae bacterium]|nr:KUP/HAK/KT family potassium transporter [Polyangiaceae bacterium]
MHAVSPPGNEDVPAASHSAPAHPTRESLGALALGALGVVYGDIGTSPLYALRECVHGSHALATTNANILSLLSLMFWSVTLVVTVKYLGFIMRADNDGEGGILALLALLPEGKASNAGGKLSGLAALALFGAALLYGDGIITPAISVLSAIEGLGVATHALEHTVVPITVGILLGLFAWQKRGTNSIGRVFGPIMVVWFLTLAVLGVIAISKYPAVLGALNPWHAVQLFLRTPGRAFLVLGSVVLCITGGEALYADMGHFGRQPIRVAWYIAVFPALALNYLGQGALLLSAPEGGRADIAANPFYALVPNGPAIYPLVALATAAAVIASQALISGAFSLTRQAVQLGFMPRATVIHTSSETEGQIYIPEVNWALAVSCIALVLAFQDSTRLAAAYGIAVTGTMAITSLAFYQVARRRWKWPAHLIGPLVTAFLILDLAFFASNAFKFLDGGFVPIVLAFGIFSAMRIWKRGRALLGQYFARATRPLDQFLLGLHDKICRDSDGAEIPIVRVPGVAVFLTSNPEGTPPLLLHHLRHVRSLHETVILLTVATDRVPRVASDRSEFERLSEGFLRLRVHAGFMESPNVPRALGNMIRRYDLPFTLQQITYFLGRETLLATSHGQMKPREESIFAFLTRNSQNATRYFGIPPERVVEIGMQVDL